MEQEHQEPSEDRRPRVILRLLKIVCCEKYAEDFLNGKLYCNTVRYFRGNESEDSKGNKRYDKFEGAAFLPPSTFRITARYPDEGGRVESHTIPAEDLAGPITVMPDLIADLNVFCMFAWSAPKVGESAVRIDLESQLGGVENCVDDFGPHTVVVKDVTEFLRRVDLAAQQDSRVLKDFRGPVRYVKPETQPTDPFTVPLFKQERFSHQKEYRFVFHTNLEPARPLELRIGDIRDIAFRMSTENIYESVKVSEQTSSA